MAVDRLGGGRAVVAGQQGDVLHGDAGRGQDGHEGVPHLPRYPVFAEACLLGDYPECADHVVGGQGGADPGGEDQAVVLPEFTGPQPVSGLKRVVLPQRLGASLR
jgi:hypothetical protein